MNTLHTIVISMSLGALALSGCDSGDKPAKPKTAAKSDAEKAEPAGKDAPTKETPAADTADKGADKGADAAADGGDAAADAVPTDAEVVDTLDKRVTRVAKLAEQIEAKPEDADKILEAAELDREEFDALVYAIGADPDLSKQYQLARAGE